MIKLPKKQTPKESAHPDIHAVAVGWNECIDEVQRLNATAQPVSDGCKVQDGWKLVPVEPTEKMLIAGFESEPDEFFSNKQDWEAYQEMSGCEQAEHRARLCWNAMLAAAPGGQDE
ncbi:hypothetical protein ACQV2E_06440 [Pantoea allii]|uniref:hypothetical protein n=1 Tax=Pantoea allii TaxID=574096 RepID=UPI003D31D617